MNSSNHGLLSLLLVLFFLPYYGPAFFSRVVHLHSVCLFNRAWRCTSLPLEQLIFWCEFRFGLSVRHFAPVMILHPLLPSSHPPIQTVIFPRLFLLSPFPITRSQHSPVRGPRGSWHAGRRFPLESCEGSRTFLQSGECVATRHPRIVYRCQNRCNSPLYVRDRLAVG